MPLFFGLSYMREIVESEAKKVKRRRMKPKDILQIARLYPGSWWTKYAMFSMIVPLALLFNEQDHGASLSMVVPLLVILFLGYCYTFVLNYITDVREDSLKENQVKIDESGILWLKIVCGVVLLINLIIAISFLSLPGLFLFIGLEVFSTLYSWGPRLKESVVGPIIGSMFYWGPIPLVVIHLRSVEGIGISKAFSTTAIVYLVCIFFFGMVKELSHNIFDFEIDRKAGLGTFGQIVGEKRTKNLIIMFKALYVPSFLLFGYFISIPVFIISILFILAGILGLYRTKYFFSFAAVWLLMDRNLGSGGILLLFLAIPPLVKAIVHLINKIGEGGHRSRASLTHMVDCVHARNRKMVFSILERVK